MGYTLAKRLAVTTLKPYVSYRYAGNHTRIAYLIYIRQQNPRQAILISLLDKMTISLFLFPQDFSASSGGLY